MHLLRPPFVCYRKGSAMVQEMHVGLALCSTQVRILGSLNFLCFHSACTVCHFLDHIWVMPMRHYCLFIAFGLIFLSFGVQIMSLYQMWIRIWMFLWNFVFYRSMLDTACGLNGRPGAACCAHQRTPCSAASQHVATGPLSSLGTGV